MAKEATKPAVRTNKVDVPVWNYQDDLVPRPGTPGSNRLAKRQRWFRRYTKSAVYLLPVVLLLSMLVVLSGARHDKTPPASDSGAATSPGRNVATLEVEKWLAEDPSPLPGATIESWDGAKDVAPTTAHAAGPLGSPGEPTWTAELDTFTLVVGDATNPTVYTAIVEVAMKPGGGEVALSGPSLTLVPSTGTSSGWDTGAPWSGITITSTVKGPVQSAINGWLTAYTSGSATQLRLSVGDTRGSVHYLPLKGVASAHATVVASALRVAPNAPVAAKTKDPSAEIVDVTLNILWKGEKIPTNLSETPGPETTMDLLIERANTAAPVVVAWGPAGTGPSLVPYQNAVRY
jgi:hypothetical protein